MMDFDRYWGHSREALSCAYNPEFRGNYYQWMHTDQLENWNPKTTAYKPDDFGYHINSYGYRGPEIDHILEDPTNTIMYLGCSFTFGIGCPFEDTWAYQLHQALCKRDGKEYKYLNLSIGGAGEDFITRTLSNWLPMVKPMAVFILFPEPTRRELIYPGNTWLDRHGASYPVPKPPKTIGQMFGINVREQEWKNFHNANIDGLDGDNQYWKWMHHINTISILLKDTPWFWQTWDVVFRQYLEDNPSFVAAQRKHLLPYRLPFCGVETSKGWFMGSGRDSSHSGILESVKFVERNLPHIPSFNYELYCPYFVLAEASPEA